MYDAMGVEARVTMEKPTFAFAPPSTSEEGANVKLQPVHAASMTPDIVMVFAAPQQPLNGTSCTVPGLDDP